MKKFIDKPCPARNAARIYELIKRVEKLEQRLSKIEQLLKEK